MIFEAVHWLGAVPVLWLIGMRETRLHRWLIALAFGVSWVADSAAHWVDPNVIGNYYPFLQSGLLLTALLDEDRARAIVALLGLAAVATIYVDVQRDVVLRTLAWGAVLWAVWPRRDLRLIRTSLLVTFGLGLLLWWGYAWQPGWTTWSLYQGARVGGTGLFCWAVCRRPVPSCASPIRS